MFDSNTEPATVAQDIIRSLFSTLDRPAYAILGIIYELFFNVATADLFSNEMVMKFYGRVQIILGVFMMFQLAMTILRGIVNPDGFTKDKGVGTLITRVITSLVLITLLMPISTSGGNEYEKQINNNGLLFGTLYSLQHRILSNNTIGRLVLGTNDSNTTFSDTATNGDSDLKKSARIFTSTILKGFYRINLVPEDQRTNKGDGKDPAVYNENRVCTDIDDSILAAYTRVDAEPGEIISLVNATCDSKATPSFLSDLISGAKKLTGSTKYIFAYTPLVSTIVPIIFIFILLSFTIDVAVRAVKLAVLRLIAPIPIIAYMDPKGGKDSAFNSWVKALTSTYLDLFIRLASVYFVIFLIQDMIVNGVSISTTAGSGFIHVLSMIIIWIGLFIFAKQAPKFIKQIFGLKDDGGKLFSGFGEIGAAMGMVASVPGAIGSGIASARASRMADETRQSFGQDVNPNSIMNRGKHLLAGISGGISGGLTGVTAAYGAKEKGFHSALEAMRKRNADVLSRGDSGSTLLGRLSSSGRGMIFGEGLGAVGERSVQNLKSKQDALDVIKKRVSGEMVKKDWTYGNLGIEKDQAGNAIGKVNFKAFEANLAAGRSRGDGVVHFKDQGGVEHTISIDDAERQRGYLLKMNEDNYIEEVTAGRQKDIELMSAIKDAEFKGAARDVRSDGTPRVIDDYTRAVPGKITRRDDYTKVAEDIGQEIRDINRENTINKANDQFSGQKK